LNPPPHPPPTGLPPARPCDHHIPSSQHCSCGCPPIYIPQLQKDELEEQCATMLAQGIIRSSTSAF
jgi:hypothetical protein